jgi:hypothetical protein
MDRFVQAGPELADPYQSDRMLRSWLDRLAGAEPHAAAAPALAALADVLRVPREEIGKQVEEAVAEPGAYRVVAEARGLALRLGRVLAGALLAEHAAWSGAEPDATLATLWLRRHVGGADIDLAAARHVDDLVSS